jgi:integration host factor subunit alpha
VGKNEKSEEVREVRMNAGLMGTDFANTENGLANFDERRRFKVPEEIGKGMTKADIVEHIYERVGFSKKESADLVETVFAVIKETLSSGQKVKISGFGNFVVREKNARKGRNPQTGEEILLQARRVLTFKPSLVLKNILNDEQSPE